MDTSNLDGRCSFNRRGDSLGGAANSSGLISCRPGGFNRRGDSLGGAAQKPAEGGLPSTVSIAGAILWGVLQLHWLRANW